MAKALFPLAALFRPLHALVRRFRSTTTITPHPVPMWSRWPDIPAGCAPDGQGSPPHGSAMPALREMGLASLTYPAEPLAEHGAAPNSPSRVAGDWPSHRGATHGHGIASPRAVRVRRRHAGAPERFVIAGRMADVCAELERWAASEAVLR
ncbi:hypothetical protein [Paracidovorax anthurii]|uniref:Uncharacterized protein n=1 Tax=Paracidovorax anthurii TaxID=78229 RepID=A0A328YG97_9BURK|nr:hypothetical protein [Paracidovorax anthurii]RAR72650.1 hypothetical protein AX018_10812 [Paracidovorax anthurii]